jgi:4-phytase/acid phosphatase
VTWLGRLGAVIGLITACVLPPSAQAQVSTPAGMTLERVVMVMRHGVRPPTKAQPMAVGIAKDAWPSWDVAPGYLTSHGAQGVARIGAYQRLALSQRGLLPAQGCLAAGAVSLSADSDERTIKTAEAFAKSLAPGCNLAVAHKPQDEPDPVYSPLDPKVGTALDAQAARAAVLAHLGPAGLAARTMKNRALLEQLQRIVGCCSAPICAKYGATAPCGFQDLQTTLADGGEKPSMNGALDLASTAAQILLLEYEDGKPMDQVGWGRASKSDIEALLAFHPLEYDVVARPPYVAQRGAAPFLAAIKQALGPGGAKLTVLVGHDTNIAHIGGALDLHWKAGDFPVNDPPPAGALSFELLRDAKGARFVRAVFTAQTMDQMRNLDVLDLTHPPATQVIPLTACGAGAALCPLADFQKFLAASAPKA